VLSSKLAQEQLFVVEDFSVESGKTRDALLVLKNFQADQVKTLLLIPQLDEQLLRATRNLPKMDLQIGEYVSTYELLSCQKLLIQEGAISKLAGVLQA